LLRTHRIQIAGKKCVILGRSNIVGTPLALLLLHANGTVTICHSHTQNLKAECQQADILVCAIGKPKMVTGDWLKPGAVVIDVGINVVPDPSKKSGTALVGDADFDSCVEVAGKITPVPGGVGPMTIAMLLRNTVKLTERQLILQQDAELRYLANFSQDHLMPGSSMGA